MISQESKQSKPDQQTQKYLKANTDRKTSVNITSPTALKVKQVTRNNK